MMGEALSSDASHAAALVRGVDGKLSILVWHGGTPTPIVVVPVPDVNTSSNPTTFELSPDGSLVALGTNDGQVLAWSLAGVPRLLPKFLLGRSRITGLRFARHRYVTDRERLNPNGVAGWLLAVGDSGGQIIVRDLGRLEIVMQSRDSDNEVFALTFSPDSQTLFSAGRKEIRCTDVSSGHQLLVIEPALNLIPGLAVSPTSGQLAVCSTPVFGYEGGVKLFDLEMGRGMKTLHGLTGQVKRVSITPDGRRVAALTQDWKLAVWDVSTGELLFALDAPVALYADHDDIRLTDDGRFLIIAGGKEAQRWQLPVRSGDVPRKIDAWKLNPAWTNRLAITSKGKFLLCRSETRSGNSFPNEIHPAVDPRCVRIYELVAGGSIREIARCDDLARYVVDINAVPDGSAFIVDGIKSRDQHGNSIFAYAGENGKPLWDIQLPENTFFSAQIDSTGEVLQYSVRPGLARRRTLPYQGPAETATKQDFQPALRRQIEFRPSGNDSMGLHLAVPGAAKPFLTLSPNQPAPAIDTDRFTPDGRILVWGNENGTVNVCDMENVRERLSEVGLGWEKLP